MQNSDSQFDLLFGMAAVAEALLSPEELIDAAEAWLHGEERSLREIVVERAKLTESQQARIDAGLRDVPVSHVQESLQTDLGDEVFGALREALHRVGEKKLTQAFDGTTNIPAPDKPTLHIPREEERFEVLEALARGGLGEVFVARDKQLNRRVALKQVLERWHGRASANDRFLLEAEVTGRLEHPGVVPVYALGQREDGRFYYVMRLIRGVSLEEEVREYFIKAGGKPRYDSLEFRALLGRFVDVCNTMDYAHSRGVVHRDLKPANIMVGKYGETLVVDWGLARRLDAEESDQETEETMLAVEAGGGSTATRAGSVLGTPSYMSPEQAAGQSHAVRAASDIYSLGATFYSVLTGQPPQAARPVEKLLEDVKQNRFPMPSAVREGVPKPLEAICLGAMRLRESERYESAGAMAKEIERWLGDERVLAYDEPLTARAARSVRRHQAAAAATVVALVLLSLGVGIGSWVWQQHRLNEQEHAAELRRQAVEAKREDDRRLEQRRASVEASLRAGLLEAQSGRFESALNFLRQGEREAAGDPRLKQQGDQLSGHAQTMQRLADYRRLSGVAMQALAYEEDERCVIITIEALLRLGVFEHTDWWDHLPDELLTPADAERLARNVHQDLVVLAGMLAKGYINPELISRRALGLPPPEFNDRNKLFLEAFRTVAKRAQAYSTTQILSRLQESGRYLCGEISQYPKPPRWRADSLVDAYHLGALCLITSYHTGLGFGSTFVESFLGIQDRADAASRFLRRASDIDPEYYLAHVMLGWAEQRRGDYDAAKSSLSHAISLRPDEIIAYDLRSYTQHEEAIQEEDPTERRRLLKAALQDANASRRINPQYEVIHWLRGDALRGLEQPAQASQAYLDALEREPPLDMVRLQQWQFILQGRDPNRVRRLSYLLTDRFDEALAYAEHMQESYPETPLYGLLEAAASLELRDLERAAGAADNVIENATQASPKTLARAFALRGQAYRRTKEWERARDMFAEALKLHAGDTTAAEGMAAVLTRLAQSSDDPQAVDLALAACDHLASVSQTDWQRLRALRERYALLLRRGDFEAAQDSLERILALDRGFDLDPLLALAKEAGATAIAQRISESSLDHLLSEMLVDAEPIKTAPLRNPGFELGLSVYWSPWMIEGGAIAEANISPVTRDEHGASLKVQFFTEASPECRASLAQSLPVVSGVEHRVTLWCRGESLAPASVGVVVDEQWEAPVVVAPSGTYDWREISGEFVAPEAVGDDPQTVTLRIVAAGPAEAWIDDLRVEVLREESR